MYHGGGGGFGMSPCIVLVCGRRRLLADRHSLPFPWTLSLHRRGCPSASQHPVSFLSLLGLSFPPYFPFLSLGIVPTEPPDFPCFTALGRGGGGVTPRSLPGWSPPGCEVTNPPTNYPPEGREEGPGGGGSGRGVFVFLGLQWSVSALGSGRACPTAVIAFCSSCQCAALSQCDL